MELLTIAIKVLLLMACAVFALGFGLCGAAGFALSYDNVNKIIVLLSLAGFSLMAFFGWLSWRMLKWFFPAAPPSDSSGKGA